MPNRKSWLHDPKDNSVIVPKTKLDAVYDNNGKDLKTILAETCYMPDGTPITVEFDKINKIEEIVINNCTFRKKCGLVRVFIGDASFDEDGKTIGTLPVEYRPLSPFFITSKIYNGSSYEDCKLKIDTNGIMTVVGLFNQKLNNIQLNYFLDKNFVYSLF